MFRLLLLLIFNYLRHICEMSKINMAEFNHEIIISFFVNLVLDVCNLVLCIFHLVSEHFVD